jgi:hypothetical protein
MLAIVSSKLALKHDYFRLSLFCALYAVAEGLLARVCITSDGQAQFLRMELDDLYSKISNRSSIYIGPRPGVSSNVGSISVSKTTGAALVAFVTNGNDKLVNILNLSQPTSPTFLNACPAPQVTFAGASRQADLHCVVWMGDQLYVVYDAPFGNGIIASLNVSTCEFMTLGSSPGRVSVMFRFSVQGPDDDRS